MKRMKTKPKGEKKNGGRPSKYTPELVAELCRLIARERKWRAGAAEAVGITTETMRQWEKIYPEFSSALKQAFEDKVDRCCEIIEEAATMPKKEGIDWAAAAWIAERTFPERFSLNRRIDRDDDADTGCDDIVSIDVSFQSGKSVAVVFKQEAPVKELNRAVDDTGSKDEGAARA